MAAAEAAAPAAEEEPASLDLLADRDDELHPVELFLRSQPHARRVQKLMKNTKYDTFTVTTTTVVGLVRPCFFAFKAEVAKGVLTCRFCASDPVPRRSSQRTRACACVCE